MIATDLDQGTDSATINRENTQPESTTFSSVLRSLAMKVGLLKSPEEKVTELSRGLNRRLHDIELRLAIPETDIWGPSTDERQSMSEEALKIPTYQETLARLKQVHATSEEILTHADLQHAIELYGEPLKVES